METYSIVVTLESCQEIKDLEIKFREERKYMFDSELLEDC